MGEPIIHSMIAAQGKVSNLWRMAQFPYES